jgi:hypothetical protein
MKISQSLMKEFRKYFYASRSSDKMYEGNNCGLLFKAKYIDKTLITPPSDSMAEGIYFEYMATGSVPRTGIPEPERTMKGELTAAYKRAVEAAEFFKEIIEHYDIKILEKSYLLQNENMTGLLDLLVEWDGAPAIIDLKYSGLMEDKWSDLGWNTDALPTKENIMIQGVHYSLLARDVLGMDLPFYFWVFSSKDPQDMKIIKQQIDEDYFQQHYADVLKTQELLKKEIEIGFKPISSYKNCKNCPLKETCPERTLFPKPVTIYYSGPQI